MENLEKKFKNSKVVATQYAIKLNSEIVATKSSRKEANEFVKTMQLASDNDVVDLVRQNVTEYHIASFRLETKKVLVASELSLDNEQE